MRSDRPSAAAAKSARCAKSCELERFRAKLAKLDPDTRDVIEALTQGIVHKLLHEPTVRVKDAAGTPRGDYYADALASLFDLPTED